MSTEILEHPNKQCKGHRACSQPVSRNIVHNMPCQIPLLTVWLADWLAAGYEQVFLFRTKTDPQHEPFICAMCDLSQKSLGGRLIHADSLNK